MTEIEIGIGIDREDADERDNQLTKHSTRYKNEKRGDIDEGEPVKTQRVPQKVMTRAILDQTKTAKNGIETRGDKLVRKNST